MRKLISRYFKDRLKLFRYIWINCVNNEYISFRNIREDFGGKETYLSGLIPELEEDDLRLVQKEKIYKKVTPTEEGWNFFHFLKSYFDPFPN